MSKKGNYQTSAFLCPFKFSKKKSKKTYDNHPNNTRHTHSLLHPHPCISNCESVYRPFIPMYVAEDYHEDINATDEISLRKGDKVFLQYIDDETDHVHWAYVSTSDGRAGFVPISILIRFNNGIKKKIIPKSVSPEMTSPPSSSFSLRRPTHHQSFHNLHSNRLLATTYHNLSQTMRPGEVTSNKIFRHQHQHCQHRQHHQHDYLNHISQQAVLHHPCQHTDDTISEIQERYKKEFLGEFVVLFNFTQMAENDISVEPMEIVHVLNKDDPDWYYISRDLDKEEGFVPSQFLCERSKYLDQYNKLVSCDHSLEEKQTNIYQNQNFWSS